MTPTSNDIFVYKLYLREDELKKICNYYRVFGYDAEDIIQECYLKLLTFPFINRYELPSGEPNINVIFSIIRNLIVDFKKRETNFIADEIFDIIEIEEEESKEEMFQTIYTEIDNLPEKTRTEWFDKQIIRLYVEEAHTIRSLEKVTRINRSTIQPIIHQFKTTLKVKVKKGDL
jgi:RNA polymerase sigma factor (sigma-70 family)